MQGWGAAVPSRQMHGQKDGKGTFAAQVERKKKEDARRRSGCFGTKMIWKGAATRSHSVAAYIDSRALHLAQHRAMHPRNVVRLWSLGSMLTKAGCLTGEQCLSRGLEPWQQGLWQSAAHAFKSVPYIDRSFLDNGSASDADAARTNAPAPAPWADRDRRSGAQRGDSERRQRFDNQLPAGARSRGQRTEPSSSSSSSMDQSPGALPLNHRITSSIKRCQSLHEVLEIIRKEGVYFNPTNINAAMKQLTVVTPRTGRPPHHPQQQQQPDADAAKEAALPAQPDGTAPPALLHAALILLARLAQHQIQDFDPRQLSGCSWAAARLVSSGAVKAYSAATISTIMLEHACSRHGLRDATPTDLSLLAWSAYILKYYDAKLLEVVATSTLAIPPAAYQDFQIVNIFTLCASARTSPPRLFSTFCTHLVDSGRLASMEARHVQQLAFACASVKHADAALVAGIARRAEQLLGSYKTVELSGLVSSLSTLGWTEAGVYQKAGARVEAALRGGGAVQPRHVVRLLFQQSLATLADEQRRDSRLVRSDGLMEAARPVLIKASTLNESSMAVAILTAEVLHGNQAAAPDLMRMLASLTPELVRMSHQSFELQKELLLGLVHSLKHIAAGLQLQQQQTAAAAAQEPSGDGQQAGHGVGSEGAGRSGHEVVTAFSAALRTVAVARLSSMSAEERAIIASNLVTAADATAPPPQAP